jgi:hypothetical protein
VFHGVSSGFCLGFRLAFRAFGGFERFGRFGCVLEVSNISVPSGGVAGMLPRLSLVRGLSVNSVVR